MDHDPGFTYLAIAYAGFFLLLAAFVVRLQRRGRELEREVEILQARAVGAGSDG